MQPLVSIQDMGPTRVTATVRNPADSSKSWRGDFVVDVQACNSFVPRSCLAAIDLQPRGERTYELADGREVTGEVTTGEIEFRGALVGGTIVYGDDDAEPVLGMTALAAGGFEFDPIERTIRKLRAVRPGGRTSPFWSHASLADLAQQQHVAPVDDLESIAALWPAADDADALLAHVLAERAVRRQAHRSRDEP